MIHIFENLDQFIKYRTHLNGTIGFVPSLGGLHLGHISLIKKSMIENDHTIVSIFLNPTQFNDPNDLKNYPSTWEEDFKILEELKVNVVLKPTLDQIYPDDYSYKIIEGKVSQDLCGATRPGHFDGVLTVVMKLLNITTPHKAYFGEKDYQQLLLIKSMVNAFFMKTQIVACPIIREESGLALSSRNRLLNESEAEIAPLIYKTISSNLSLDEMKTKLIESGFKIDYLKKQFNRIFIAAFLGQVRLIDNVSV